MWFIVSRMRLFQKVQRRLHSSVTWPFYVKIRKGVRDLLRRQIALQKKSTAKSNEDHLVSSRFYSVIDPGLTIIGSGSECVKWTHPRSFSLLNDLYLPARGKIFHYTLVNRNY